MECRVSYRSPVSDSPVVELAIDDAVRIGRAPGDNGITLLPEDTAISSTAVRLEIIDGQLAIHNSSSYAQIDVRHQHGLRFLFPGEALATPTSCEISIPGSTYTHRLVINISNADHKASTPLETTPLVSHGFSIAPERRNALVALCAARFFPERFGSALLPASEISRLLTQSGDETTAKAVNNKLQRVRDDIAARLGVYLDRRDDLADWVIRNGYITSADVEKLLNL